jgi:hypothetical protein
MDAFGKLDARESGTQDAFEALKIVAMFCGVGLTLSLLFATYGLDLSPGFF